MKKSKKSQEKTRITLIETAIHLMIQKGFESTTMREIARTAGVGDATIYTYFPSKERIVWAYIQLRQQQAIQKINNIAQFDSYTLQEKLHIYFETILEGYLPDREFLPTAFKMTQHAFITHSADIKNINSLFLDQTRLFLTDAIEKNEIPNQSIETLLPNLILDLYFIVLLYWSKDESENFQQSTQLTDLLLAIMMGILQQGLISKVMELGAFFFRNHLFTQIDSLLKNSPFSAIRSELNKFT